MKENKPKRLLALLLSMVLLWGTVPLSARAADYGQVLVSVVNYTTYHMSDGAAWDGELVHEWVELDADSTMMSCIVAALEINDCTQTGAESGYISEIDGLSAFDGGTESGWMGTLNDWFTNEGFDQFTVKNGKLQSGDEIAIMYTTGLGSDLGSNWDNNDKSVKALSFSSGSLSPAFAKDVHSYTLTVPADTTAVKVTPTASNRNYQVRNFVGSTEYKRTAAIPVTEGTVITVKCGDPSWPSMNDNSGEAQTYTVTVHVEQDEVMLGDVNGDSKLTQADVTILNTVFKGKKAESAEILLSGDLNKDGKITQSDVTALNAVFKGKKTL